MKKKIFFIVDEILLLGLIISSCILCSSWFNQNLNQKFYEVYFRTNGGTEIPTVQVLQGTRVERPEDPLKTGYTFKSWQFNEKDWDFAHQVVNQNMALIATWEAIE